jgi:hypothetical protein
MEKVIFLVLLLALLCIKSGAVESHNRSNHKVNKYVLIASEIFLYHKETKCCKKKFSAFNYFFCLLYSYHYQLKLVAISSTTTREEQRVSPDAGESEPGDKSSSHDAILGPKMGNNVVSYVSCSCSALLCSSLNMHLHYYISISWRHGDDQFRSALKSAEPFWA